MLFHLHGWEMGARSMVARSMVLAQLPPVIHADLKAQKLILGTGNIGKAWLKDDLNLGSVLRYFVYVNRFLQHHQQPLHNLLPLCSLRIHFITVDTSVLYGILADANIIDSKKCSGASFEKLGMEHWKSTFSIMPIEGQHATFTGTVDTDGTAACFHFKTLKAYRVSCNPSTTKKYEQTARSMSRQQGTC